MKKFMKTYFIIEDNIIEKKLQKYIDDMSFSSKKNVKNIIQKMIECYAENFCDGNRDKARTLLLEVDIEMRRKDSIMLAFFSGTLLITTMVTIFTLAMPSDRINTSKVELGWHEIMFTMPVFRFAIMLIFALCLIAFDVYILRKYRVNYMFIFGLDPHYKITHI